MGTPQFPELGQHCSVADCGINDFLPFSCDRCCQVFCLEHRGYAAHACPLAAAGDATVILCPLCGASVKLAASQDPNLVWEAHVRAGCNPAQLQAAMQRRKCPVKGCKELLKSSNTVRCKDCAVDVCLRHRFGPEHACQGPRSAASSSMWATGGEYGSRLLGNLQTSMSSFGLQGSAARSQATPSAVPPQIRNGSSAQPQARTRSTGGAGRGSAGHGSGSQTSASTAGRASVARTAQGRGSGQGPPRDGLRAASARDDPANTLRGSAQRRMAVGGAGPGGPEACPQCSARFPDAVALVEHVQRIHEQKGGSNCILS